MRKQVVLRSSLFDLGTNSGLIGSVGFSAMKKVESTQSCVSTATAASSTDSVISSESVSTHPEAANALGNGVGSSQHQTCPPRIRHELPNPNCA